MAKTRIRPNAEKSRSTGVKPFLEKPASAFPNMMRRVTQTARDWVTREKHSEKIKPYLNPGLGYPTLDDFYPTPFEIEAPWLPDGEWTDVTAGEDLWRFQCIISCRHTTNTAKKCTAPIKCTYGAWTYQDDGNVGGWQFYKEDGTDITGDLIVEWKPSEGRTGEIWATPKTGTWGDITDDIEDILAVYRDSGNAPGAYYHPILKRWFQLVGGESVCDAEAKIDCDCECGTLAFDDDSTPDTIAAGGSVTLYALNGCPPYRWSTGSVGYSFGAAKTLTPTTSLISASGTCGTDYDPYATVTVTDACDESVSFNIRNTGGQWRYDYKVPICSTWACGSCYVDPVAGHTTCYEDNIYQIDTSWGSGPNTAGCTRCADDTQDRCGNTHSDWIACEDWYIWGCPP